MESNKNYFDLVSSQRYFHLVAFKYNSYYSATKYWKEVGLKRSKDFSQDYAMPEFNVQQTRIVSQVKYYGGEKDYSIKGNGEAPFHYDHFVIDLTKSSILIVAFPFRKMADDIISKLIEKKNLLSFGKFIKPSLNKLIKSNDSKDFVEEHYMSNFSSVELKLTGDKDISLVALDGDKPLNSSIYKDIFKKLLESEECKLEQCSLKIEIPEMIAERIPRTKASIHLDQYGNYKLYLHGSGKNIFTLPYMFNLLRKYKCIEETTTNPITKIKDDQP